MKYNNSIPGIQLLIIIMSCILFMSSCSLFNFTTRSIAQKMLQTTVRIDVIQKIDLSELARLSNSLNPAFVDPQEEKQFDRGGLGSGVIVDKHDDMVYVLTNLHVLGLENFQERTIEVTLFDGRKYTAEVIGSEDRRDIAVLMFTLKKGETVSVAKLGNSDKVKEGEWVMAFGSPFGYDFSVSSGIISALGRSGTEIGSVSDFIQTDLAINQGNSGGPLVNLRGEVIGINTWITTANSSEGSIGLSFALPINRIKRVLYSIITNGEVQYPWLGINMYSVTPQYALDNIIQNIEYGVLITGIYRQSPAEKAGIQLGDVITAVNGQVIKEANNLILVISNLDVGSIAHITTMRAGHVMTFNVPLALTADEKTLVEQTKFLWPGFTGYSITESLYKEYIESYNLRNKTKDVDKEVTFTEEKFPQSGVILLMVIEQTAFYKAQLRAYDIVIAIDGNKIHTIYDMYAILERDNEEFEIEYYHEDTIYTTTVTKPFIQNSLIQENE